MRVGLCRFSLRFGIIALALAFTCKVAFGQGVALRGVSPINESIGGVAVATPIDATGALHWNPASISALPSSDISFGFETILPSSNLSSSVRANSFGAGRPAVNLSGSTDSEGGAVPVPSMGFVQKVKDTPWTYGLGIYGIGGSRVNYAASTPGLTCNPILTPQAPNGYGLGRLSAEVEIYQLAPTLAYQVNDQLSVGFAPTITMARLVASPLFLGPSYDDNHDGYAQYSSGVGTRYHWGGGFQVGAFYKTDYNWNFGASLKSPQWMEPFRYKSEDEYGYPESAKFNLYYPMIAALGASYTGWEQWVVGCDLKYFDYANTLGFGKDGFNSDGSLSGLGWNSIMSVALGCQRQVGERLFLRAGYSFNENPISSSTVQYNVASPLIIQHTLNMGFSYNMPGDWLFSMAYVHCFENSVTGQWINPATNTPVAGTSLTETASADVISFGVSKRY